MKFNCGAEGTRTPDPHTASVMRYQLRHSPNATERYTPVNARRQGGAALPGQPSAAARAGSLGLTVLPLTTIVGVPKPLLPFDSCCSAGSFEACW